MGSGGGFFGLFNHAKPGRGIGKNEPKLSHTAQFFVFVKRKFWKLLQLNLLYIIFCIPIVTIGPATAALTYIMRLYANEQPVFMFSDFWEAFKTNWKQSFIHSVLVAAATILLYFAITFYWQNAPQFGWMYLLLGLAVMLAIVFFFADAYIGVMIVTLDLKLKHILKNAFIIAVLRLKSNFVTLLIVGVWWIVLYLFFPLSIPIILLLGFSFPRFVMVYNVFPGVDKYTIQPFLQKQKDAEESLELETEEESIFSDVHGEKDEDESEKADKEKSTAEKTVDSFLGK